MLEMLLDSDEWDFSIFGRDQDLFVSDTSSTDLEDVSWEGIYPSCSKVVYQSEKKE